MGYIKSLMMASVLILSAFSEAYLQASCSKKNKADYVIIGVGTAGAAMAKELTDDKKTSVIALHSGKNLTDDPLIKYTENAIFTVAAGLLPTPLYENGDTIPQPEADNREILWAIGLPEGGASSINAGAWCRGTNQVYSQWETIAGPNWSVNRIEEIYNLLETFHGNTTDPAAHGYNGPLSVRQIPDPSNVSITFSQAITNATGFPEVLDYNDPNTPIGPSTQFQYTQSFPTGEYRVSSATAFLNEKVMTPKGFGVHGRKLRVFFDSFALRTIWKGNKAIGVEYSSKGKTKKVYANKGVIVCAGLRSSVFLMQSGVGPQSLLNSLNIPVVFDNPNVGQALADQPQMPLIFTSNPLDFSLEVNNGLFDSLAWLPAVGGTTDSPRLFRLAVANPFPGIVVALFDMVQPLSRGSVSISSANPFDPPVVNLGTFTDAGNQDLTNYIDGFQNYITAINTQVNLIDSDYELIYPSPATISDTSALTDFLRENVACNQCFQCQCLMAPQNQGGVVDSTGHVYGVQNLIVADDSIVPQAMDGTPMASAYLIAVNIARLLLGL